MASSSDGSFVFEARGEREIVMAYSFDAPPERLFEAWTSCESMAHWYGPEGHALVVCEMDLRAGGSWRFVTRDASGQETALRGVYQEIAPPTRLVQTEMWEEMPDFVTTVTSTLVPEGAGTRMTSVAAHPAAESRDGAVGYGMEWGVRQTFERLAAHLTATQG